MILYLPGSGKGSQQLAQDYPHVHVVEPVPLGGELGYYSGEDMPEKTSMMAYSDVFLTVYSTMVVEAAIHDRPIVSMCIDAPGGWNRKDHFSLALSEIGEWPTHQRFRQAGAGKVIFDTRTTDCSYRGLPQGSRRWHRVQKKIYPGRSHLHRWQCWQAHRRISGLVDL